MKILALDDSETALRLLTEAITAALPKAEVFAFVKPSELLEFTKDTVCEIAFLDIEVWGTSGLAVAKKLKDSNHKINIIFVTAYSEYASQAFELYPSGYVLKPVTKEAIKREIENLRHPVNTKYDARIYVQTFGNFEIFSYGIPLKFNYSKTKELIAYLVDRNGATVSVNELCAVLWENKQDTSNLRAYLRKLTSDLYSTLKEIDAEDIIIKKRGSISILPQKLVCDSYGFIKGDPGCVNAYSGEYMMQYSWAETTTGFLTGFN